MNERVISIVNKEQIIEHLLRLRATLAHALTQRNISAKRFNEIREQLLPLDEQLRNLGVDPEPTPQMQAAYRGHLSRAERRQRHRASKFPSYEQRTMRKLRSAE